ncbi:MAG: LysM peptidoglycan-binding domain-containing protein [Candidatus Limnocylindrales bacterium]
MTERGLPSADVSPVCPFVAFEGERDERADRPDHRHRCYAESEPAPRALAHQEAYCLSSAFPVCPVFQEWARREAARARAAGEAATPSPGSPTAEPPLVAPLVGSPTAPSGPPNGEADEWLAPSRASDDLDGEYDPHRNPRRDWAAPPPWATGGGPGTGASRSGGIPGVGGTHRRSDVPDFLEAAPDEGRGLAGSAADRLAMGASAGTLDTPSSGPDPDLASLVAGSLAAHPGGDRVVDERLADDRAAERALDDEEYSRSATAIPRSTRIGRRPAIGSTRASDRARDRDRLPVHEHVQGVDGPSWERARRYEAYPAIRARAAVSGLPRVAVLAGALAIAALVLFFLPALLGVFGGGDAETSPSPAPSPSVAVESPSIQPSTGPAPAVSTYVIKPGDTLSKVAADFGLTLEQLMEANVQTITNPDLIAVGDEILIPIPPPDEVPGTVLGSPSPSPSP